jgi:DNA-binding transcriptional ArsR family regulator
MNVSPQSDRQEPPGGGRDVGLDRVFTALADPTRRAILRRLADGEARVTTIAEPFPISLNSVSKHLRALEEAELVSRRRVGREHLLSLNPGRLDEVGAWIAEIQDFWSIRLDALDQVLQARRGQSAQAGSTDRDDQGAPTDD